MAISTSIHQPDIEERLARIFQKLGIQRAHVAAGYAAHAVALVSARPDLVSSLALVCPSRFDAGPLGPLGRRVLYIHGDRGGQAALAPKVVATLTEATVVTLHDYADALWSDAFADRPGETASALLAFLAEMSRDGSVVPIRLPEGVGEAAGIRFHVQGSGPPVVLLPLNLARSQWDQVAPVLAQQYCTITLSGSFLGFVPFLEERMRGGYNAVVRALVDAAEPRPGESLLEVGCGSGTIARWLARYTAGANEITAVDVNSYLLREATSLAKAEGIADRITFREGNAEALALPDNSVDVSLSFTVMEEVDADRMLREMIRVTKPGGRVGVVVRATDMQLWTNLSLHPELLAKVKSAPGGGAADHGCADASLYARFRAAGLHDLNMGPQLATNTPEHGAELLRNVSARILQALVEEEAEECRVVLARSIDDGTFLWTDPYHTAVGRKGRAGEEDATLQFERSLI